MTLTIKRIHKIDISQPTKLTKEMAEIIAADPFMKLCIHEHSHGIENDKKNRLTWEHSYCYARKQIQERVFIVPTLAKYNLDAHGDTKDFNIWVALTRLFIFSCRDYEKMIEIRYPKNDFKQKWNALDTQFVLNDYAELKRRLFDTGRITGLVQLKNGMEW